MKNIIFDFDGTLGDSEKCSIKATQAAFKAENLPVPSAEDIIYYMGIPIERSFKEMGADSLSEKDFSTLLTVFRDYYAAYEDQCLAIFPGIIELLDRLKRKEIKLFVVSSKKTSVLERNLGSLGIAAYFLEAVGSDKVSHYKPHPEGIDYIVEKYQLKRDETLMVGDAIFDIQMGKAAKVRTCGVLWGSHDKDALAKEQPDALIDSPLSLRTDFLL